MQQQMAMQGMNPNTFSQAYAVPQPAHVQTLGNPMQQHLSQIQRPVQSVNTMEMPPHMVNGQPAPNMAPQRAPQNQGQPQFSQQEQQMIVQLAETMAANATPEQMNSVQRMIMNMPADQRQQLQNQNISPVHAIFRQHAMRKFVNDRAVQQQRIGQGRPTSQVSMRPGQQPPQPPTQHLDPSFDQFLGQQQDALRHQEAGQVVVPASQGAPPQVRGTPHAQPQNQFGARPMQAPNNFQQQPATTWNTSQGQHQTVPQMSQTQAQSQIPPQTPNLTNMSGQTPQQQSLQGQLGGLDNSRAQRTPQQNPNMPTLNRPLNPPNQAQSSQRQAQSTPTNGPRTVAGGQPNAASNGQPSGAQSSSQINLQKFQAYVAKMPEPQRSNFLAQFKMRQARKKADEAAAPAAAPNAPVAPMSGDGSQSQPAAKPNTNAPQPQTTPVNRLNGQPQMAQPSGPPNGARLQQQKSQPISLDENTTRIMDRVEFPRSLLSVTGDNAKPPEHIKQWGQLKQWVHQNAAILPQGSLQKVVGLQSIVYQQKVAQSNQHKEASNLAQSQGNLRVAQPGVAPPAQMIAPNSSQPPNQPPTAPFQYPTPPIPGYEVAAARAQLPPGMKTASDEQLRMMIMNKRRNDYFKNLEQNQQNLTPQQQQQLQARRLSVLRAQQQQQANGPQTQVPMQPNQHDQSQPQPPQRGQNQQPPPGPQWPQPQPPPKMAQSNLQQTKQPPPNRSGPQASIVPPNQKGGKRNSNNDDVVEVPDPKLSQQQIRQPTNKSSQFQPPSQSQPQPPANNSLAHITPEKYNALPPDQKARFRHQVEQAQRANGQRLGQNPQGQRPMENANKTTVPNAGRDGRVKELRTEVMRSMPARSPIPMSPNTRARMCERLKSAGNMSQRLESSLPLYLSLSKDEETTKDLLRAVSLTRTKSLETAN